MLENPFLYSLAIALVHFIWQGCLVALVLKVFLTFVSTKQTQLRYTFSTIAMLINLILPIATFYVIYHTDFEQLTDSHTMITTLVKSINSSNKTDFSTHLVEYLPFISIAWLASISYLIIKLVFDVHFVSKLTKVGIVHTEKPLARRFIELAQELELPIMPRLLISLKADIPMAVGWLKPAVLLPASMISGLSTAQLEMLILHELAHIKRHDYVINFIQTIVELLLFFHPAVRWVSTQMRNEREFCSDDIAVHHCCKPIAYARTLTETAALCHKNTRSDGYSIPQMALAASGGDLKQRVVRLVDSQCTSNNDLGKWFASIFLLSSLLLISTRQLLTLPPLDENFAYLPFSSKQQPNFTQQINSSEIIDLSQTPIAQHLLDENNNVNSINKLSVSLDETFPLQHKKTSTKTSFSIPIAALDQPLIHLVIDHSKLKIQHNVVHTVEPIEYNSVETKGNAIPAQVNKNMFSENTVKHSNEATQISKENTTPKIETNKNTLFTQKEHVDMDVLEQFKAPVNPYAEEISNLAQPSNSLASPPQSTTKMVAGTEKRVVTSESAQLITSFDPKYPALAKRKKLEIEVLVHFNVDRNGYVNNIEFDQQGKVSYFRRSIRAALRKWRFEPAKVNNKPIESTMSRIFSFSLTN